MYIVRDIFRLKFGHFKDAKALLDEARKKNMLPDAKNIRTVSDFTGPSYRLIMEAAFDSLSDYEKSLMGSMTKKEWQDWYEKFKSHVESSEREILKEVI